MQLYTELLKKIPDELIEEAKTEQKSGILMEDRKILEYFDDYIEYLENRGLAPKTVEGYIGAVRSFYKKKYIQVPDLERKKAKPLKKNRSIPTKEDLQDVLKACNELERAIVLTGVSSGLSDVDIVNLKISDFKKGYDSQNKITVLRLTRIKPDNEFITFLSPEATETINDYLDYRNRTCKVNFKRENDRLDKQKVRNDNGYLFIRKHVPTSYLTSGNEEERKITETNLIQIYRGISEKAQKNTPFGDWNIIRSHNMRKYFYNVLINHGCTYPHAEYMMGHVLDSVRDAYFIPTEEALKKSYINCIPYLTIEKKLDVSESPEFIKMKNDNEVLKKEIVTKTVERDEIIRISNKFEDYKQKIDYEMSQTKMKHNLQILKMKQKFEPENKNKIQKMIDTLEDALRKS